MVWYCNHLWLIASPVGTLALGSKPNKMQNVVYCVSQCQQYSCSRKNEPIHSNQFFSMVNYPVIITFFFQVSDYRGVRQKKYISPKGVRIVEERGHQGKGFFPQWLWGLNVSWSVKVLECPLKTQDLLNIFPLKRACIHLQVLRMQAHSKQGHWYAKRFKRTSL